MNYRLSNRYPLLSDVIIGFLRKEMDLINYVLRLGKIYMRDYRRNDNKQSSVHFIPLFFFKCMTNKNLIAEKNNNN